MLLKSGKTNWQADFLNMFLLKALKSPATATSDCRTQAPFYEWYYGPMLCLENYKQITNILYPDAFTFAIQEEFPGNFHPLVVVVALDRSLSMKQGQQQDVYLLVGGRSAIIKESILEATRDLDTNCSIFLCSTPHEVMQIPWWNWVRN